MTRKRVSKRYTKQTKLKIDNKKLDFREIIKSRELITIAVDSPLWEEKQVKNLKIKDSIVRLVPPTNATDAKIEEVNSLVIANGAVATKVLPRQQIGKIGIEEDSNNVMLSTLDLRKAVHEVAVRMHSADSEALKIELDSVMDKAGI